MIRGWNVTDGLSAACSGSPLLAVISYHYELIMVANIYYIVLPMTYLAGWPIVPTMLPAAWRDLIFNRYVYCLSAKYLWWLRLKPAYITYLFIITIDTVTYVCVVWCPSMTEAMKLAWHSGVPFGIVFLMISIDNVTVLWLIWRNDITGYSDIAILLYFYLQWPILNCPCCLIESAWYLFQCSTCVMMTPMTYYVHCLTLPTPSTTHSTYLSAYCWYIDWRPDTGWSSLRVFVLLWRPYHCYGYCLRLIRTTLTWLLMTFNHLRWPCWYGSMSRPVFCLYSTMMTGCINLFIDYCLMIHWRIHHRDRDGRPDDTGYSAVTVLRYSV